jgi:hypothetical protein
MKLLRCTAILALTAAFAAGQQVTSPPTILESDVENQVEHDSDIYDLGEFATTSSGPRNLPETSFCFGHRDIVAINGQPGSP